MHGIFKILSTHRHIDFHEILSRAHLQDNRVSSCTELRIRAFVCRFSSHPNSLKHIQTPASGTMKYAQVTSIARSPYEYMQSRENGNTKYLATFFSSLVRLPIIAQVNSLSVSCFDFLTHSRSMAMQHIHTQSL